MIWLGTAGSGEGGGIVPKEKEVVRIIYWVPAEASKLSWVRFWGFLIKGARTKTW